MGNEIKELAIVLSLATVVGGIAKLIRLPMIFAYLVAGAILAASGLVPEATSGLYRLFGDLGVMFLLFLIGLEINYTSLRLVGMTSILIGLGQVIISGTVGTLVTLLLGFAPLTAGYFGIMMAFASTVVVVKLLTEKHELNSLHGKIVLGIMLVQDFVAMLLLVALAGLRAGHGVDMAVMLMTVLKAGVLFVLMLWLGRSLVPKILHRVAHTPELLFLGSIAWMFVVAALAGQLGLSIEIGGFLAGLAVANSSEQFHIANRMRPLRDFFLVLLFITLGSSLGVSDLSSLTGPIVVITLTVVVLNPIIVSLLLLAMGYHSRTAVITGLHISQLSEFSLVVAALGARIGHVSNDIISIVTVSAILSIGISSFLITHSESIYRSIRRVFRLRGVGVTDGGRVRQYDTILIGAHRLGRNILRSLGTRNVLVVDYDPDVIARLGREKYDVSYGDIGDEDILESLIAARPRVIISTSPDLEDNVGILQTMKHVKKYRPLLVVRAENDREASRLYRQGADFVLLPHLMSGISLGTALKKHDRSLITKWRTNDLKYLQEPA